MVFEYMPALMATTSRRTSTPPPKSTQSVSSTSSNIEKKKNANVNDWEGLLVNSGKSILTLVIVTLIGTNFLFFIKQKKETLNYIFPTSINSYIKNDKPGINENNLYGFPYNLSNCKTSFFYWISRSIINTWIMYRSLLKDSLEKFKEFEINDIMNMYIVAPLFFIFGLLLVVFSGMYVSLYSLLTSATPFGIFYTIMGTFLLYPLIISLLTTTGLSVSFTLTMLFYPYMYEIIQVKNIIKSNIKNILYLSVLIILYNGMSYLNDLFSMICTIIFILLILFKIISNLYS